jgi:CubicO group peptidase (beta-lactamase class C family)
VFTEAAEDREAGMNKRARRGYVTALTWIFLITNHLHAGFTPTLPDTPAGNRIRETLAVAQLCEQGKMSYDDPVDKYLGEDWIPKKIARKIQVKHLLSHTSGIGISKKDDNLVYMEESITGKFRRIEDYKALTAKASLRFKPGKKYAYSNAGMHLLGPIIEKVSGENYYDYVESHIFQAAGMHETGFLELDKLTRNTARGYVKEMSNGEVSWRSNMTQCCWKGTPAGGAYSTVGDLMKFEQALKKNTLVSGGTRELLFTPKTELNSPSYGFGFSSRRFEEHVKVGHTGGYIGINNHFSMYLDNGYTVIILSNIDMISGSMDSDIEFFITSLFF